MVEAGGGEGRKILFDLLARFDPKSRGAFDQFAEAGEAANVKVVAAAANGHAKMGKEVEKFSGKTLGEWAKISAGIDRELKAQESAARKAAKAQQAAFEKMAGSLDKKPPDLMKGIEAGAKEAEAAAKKSAVQQAAALKRVQQEADKTARAYEAMAASVRAPDLMKGLEAGAKEASAHTQAAAKEIAAAHNEREKAAAAADKKQLAALKQYEAEAKRQAGVVSAANMAGLESFNRLAEGVVKLGRGFVMAGLVGEENMQKVVNTLLKVEAVINLTRGGIEVYRGIAGMVQAYNAAVQAATASELALAAARRVSAASGATSATAAGTASQTAASVAPALALAPLIKPLLALAAAAGSTYLAFQVVKETVTGSATQLDSWSNKIAEWGNSWDEFFGFVDLGTEKLARMAEAADKAREQRRGIEERDAADLRLKNQQAIQTVDLKLVRAEVNAAGRGGDNKADEDALRYIEQRESILREIAIAERRIAENRNRGLLSETEAARHRQTLAEKLLDLDKQHFESVRAAGQESIRAAKELLKLEDEKVKKAEELAKRGRDSLKSDLAKFTELDIFERRRLESAKGKLDRGGTLTQAEAQIAAQFELFKSRADEAQARKGAFQDTTGIFRQGAQQVQLLEQRAQTAREQRIKVDNELKITIQDDKEFRQRVLTEVTRSLDERDRLLRQEFQLAHRARARQEQEALRNRRK